MNKKSQSSMVHYSELAPGFVIKPGATQRKKKDNSKKGDMFLNCRSCKTIITNDYRSKFDTRYCADCL